MLFIYHVDVFFSYTESALAVYICMLICSSNFSHQTLLLGRLFNSHYVEVGIKCIRISGRRGGVTFRVGKFCNAFEMRHARMHCTSSFFFSHSVNEGKKKKTSWSSIPLVKDKIKTSSLCLVHEQWWTFLYCNLTIIWLSGQQVSLSRNILNLCCLFFVCPF